MKKIMALIASTAIVLTSCAAPIVGDVNRDGKVTQEDKKLIQKHIKQTHILTGKQLETADVNHDGKINIFDMVKIQKIMEGQQ